MGLAQRILSLLSLSLTFSLFALRLGCPGLVVVPSTLAHLKHWPRLLLLLAVGEYHPNTQELALLTHFEFSQLFSAQKEYFSIYFHYFFSFIIVTSCPATGSAGRWSAAETGASFQCTTHISAVSLLTPQGSGCPVLHQTLPRVRSWVAPVSSHRTCTNTFLHCSPGKTPWKMLSMTKKYSIPRRVIQL